VPPRATDRASPGTRTLAAAEAELARERRGANALREAVLAIGQTTDLDDLVEIVLAKCREVTDAERSTLYLLDERRAMLRSLVMEGPAPQVIEVRVGQGIAGTVAQSGKSLRVSDAYQDPRFSRDWDEKLRFRTRSLMAAPLRDVKGTIIGVVQVLNKRGGGAFSADDQAFLEALTTPIAVIIANSKLSIRLQQANEKLSRAQEKLEARDRQRKLLLALETSMGRAGSIEEIVLAALREAARATGARAGSVLLVEGNHELSLFTLAEKSDRLARRVLGPGEDMGFVSNIVARGKRARFAGRSRLHERFESLLQTQVHSAIGEPLDHEDGVLGAIALYNKRGASSFKSEDVGLLRSIAANFSTALELRRTRTKHQQAEHLGAIGRLLSGVIHDLKTPMSVISGYAQMMETEDVLAKRTQYGEHIRKQFELIQGMQREVLEYARGEKTILIRRVYLGPFLKNLEESFRPEAEASGVKLVVEAEDKGVARFDETRVTRALHNLMRNALEAIGSLGGTLTVRATRENDSLVFAVSDDGPGIPPEIQAHLFESFVTGKKGGTGLGLSNVKNAVSEHGGTVDVKTSKKGTTFRLFFPQEKPAQERSLPEKAASEKSS
jgi:signal transduction histidine kinase/putative methionine-R-sulfoxide reductase with GAF domain